MHYQDWERTVAGVARGDGPVVEMLKVENYRRSAGLDPQSGLYVQPTAPQNTGSGNPLGVLLLPAFVPVGIPSYHAYQWLTGTMHWHWHWGIALGLAIALFGVTLLAVLVVLNHIPTVPAACLMAVYMGSVY